MFNGAQLLMSYFTLSLQRKRAEPGVHDDHFRRRRCTEKKRELFARFDR